MKSVLNTDCTWAVNFQPGFQIAEVQLYERFPYLALYWGIRQQWQYGWICTAVGLPPRSACWSVAIQSRDWKTNAQRSVI